jgi:hypothetical protein
MSLRKYDEEGSARKAKAKTEMQTAVKEKTDKRDHKKRMKLENKQIRRQIKKYKILGIPRKLRAQWKEARKEYRRAAKLEKSAKKSKQYKQFAEEHQLNKPVEKEADYPKIGGKPAEEALGESADDDHIILGHVQVENDDGESANLADSQESSAQADAQDDDSDSDSDTDDMTALPADNTAADSGPSDDEKEVQRELAEASKVDNALSDGAVQSMSEVNKLLSMPDIKL